MIGGCGVPFLSSVYPFRVLSCFRLVGVLTLQFWIRNYSVSLGIWYCRQHQYNFRYSLRLILAGPVYLRFVFAERKQALTVHLDWAKLVRALAYGNYRE
jgi:hypothetical protein